MRARFRTHSRFGRRSGRVGGFTLVEAALTTAIIGIGIMAMLELRRGRSRTSRGRN